MEQPHPLDRVVVGVDGSTTADEALRWAAQRITPDGELHVVHVADDGASERSPDWIDRAAHDAEWPGRIVVTNLDGDPAPALIDEAARVDAELIVVGAHGSGRARRWAPFIGRVTGHLLHHSPRPVVVHHGSATPIGGAVIAGVGYGRSADAVTAWAARYAQSAGCPLELHHAVSHRPLFPVDAPTDMIGSYLGAGLDREWAVEDLQDLADDLAAQRPGLSVTATVTAGSAVRTVIAAAEAGQRRAELVVVGRPPGPAARRLPISGRTRQIIAGAPCPTVVVPVCRPTG
ncbi:MAG: universal stress protein [Actinomycetota bacterium]